jgi:hypothetical protein
LINFLSGGAEQNGCLFFSKEASGKANTALPHLLSTQGMKFLLYGFMAPVIIWKNLKSRRERGGTIGRGKI